MYPFPCLGCMKDRSKLLYLPEKKNKWKDYNGGGGGGGGEMILTINFTIYDLAITIYGEN